MDIIHLHLDAPALETRARRDLDQPHFALRKRFRSEDGLLSHLSQQLLAAAGRQHTLGQLYTESLFTTLCYYLIEHHATVPRRPVSGTVAGGRLPAVVLTRLEEYLEAHAELPITLDVMAGLANLSVFYFARRFKQTTGCSPYRYVLAWKIRRARHLLRAGELPIAAISDALDFASPAYFATSFKRSTGQTLRAFQHGWATYYKRKNQVFDQQTLGDLWDNQSSRLTKRQLLPYPSFSKELAFPFPALWPQRHGLLSNFIPSISSLFANRR